VTAVQLKEATYIVDNNRWDTQNWATCFAWRYKLLHQPRKT